MSSPNGAPRGHFERGVAVPDVPPQIRDIVGRLGHNERVNRRALQTFLSWFNASRRGTAVVSNIKACSSLRWLRNRSRLLRLWSERTHFLSPDRRQRR